MTDPHADNRPHIVVLGGGFGGLNFCQTFKAPARVTLIDQHNHHLFQPLLYQVAMAGLTAPDIAQPLRTLFARRRNITVLMDTVEAIDLNRKIVRVSRDEIRYDYLVIAIGGVTTYFGHDEWRDIAPGLKSVNDALKIRSKVLTSFEQAENTDDPEEQQKLMNIVVVGGGPTGVELAGALAELTRQVFRRDFRRIDTTHSKIILIDGGDRLLSTYPPELSEKAKQQLESMGVEVRLNLRVTDVTDDHVRLDNGEQLPTRNALWAAGLVANPVTAALGVDTGHGGRINVLPDLSIPGHPEAFAIGDIVSLADEDGKPVPGVAQAAIQMGRHVARLLSDEVRHPDQPLAPDKRPPFHYHDKGSLATIGRVRAVAWIGKLKMAGFLAWLLWLGVHLFFLIGLHNRVAVFTQWVYSYLAFHRGARIIYGPVPGPAKPRTAQSPAAPREANV